MHEQVEARHQRGQIAAKTREHDVTRQAELGELGAQPPLERPAAEAHDLELRPLAARASGNSANSHEWRLRSMSCATTPTTSASAGKPNAASNRSRAAASGR